MQSDLEKIRQRRNRRADLVHEFAFVVSLGFSVAFWALLGGTWYWAIAFGALGAVVEFSEKSQLELAALEADQKKRRAMKRTAAAFMVVSLLGSLGASVMRATSVVEAEAVSRDTTSLEARIKLKERDYNGLIAQRDSYPFTYTTARDKVQARIDTAYAELQNLYSQKDMKAEGALTETSAMTMFDALAGFFGLEDRGRFLVFLLMLASAATKLGFWKTCRPLYAEADPGFGWEGTIFDAPETLGSATVEHEKPAAPPPRVEAAPKETKPRENLPANPTKSDNLF